MITFLGKLLQSIGIAPTLLAVDINEDAARQTRATAAANEVSTSVMMPCTCWTLNNVKTEVHVVLCDLANALLRRVRGRVDVLLFNPPYVCGDLEEDANDWLVAEEAGELGGCGTKPERSSAESEEVKESDRMSQSPREGRGGSSSTSHHSNGTPYPFGTGIEAALIGGESGRSVIDRFIPLVSVRGC